MTENACNDDGQFMAIDRQKLPEDTWVIRREDGLELSLTTGAAAVVEFTAPPGHRFYIKRMAEQVAAHHGGQVVLIPADLVASLFKTLAPLTSERPS